jgi:hypothetical protein
MLLLLEWSPQPDVLHTGRTGPHGARCLPGPAAQGNGGPHGKVCRARETRLCIAVSVLGLTFALFARLLIHLLQLRWSLARRVLCPGFRCKV